jgi:hypothetical protein
VEAVIERARAPQGRESVIQAAKEWRQTFDAFDRGDYSTFHIEPAVPPEAKVTQRTP